MPKLNLWPILKRWSQQESRVLITSGALAGTIVFLRFIGFLQSLEWAALDQLFRLRPLAPADDRIVIVKIDERDLQQLKQWPMSDQDMAKLLQNINALKPRAIGLDIYRNLPVAPGHSEFVETAKKIPNLIGIELLEDEKNLGVPPADVLVQDDKVGFNNMIVDADGRVRRSLLYWHVDGNLHTSFALQLAFLYLEREGITSEQVGSKPKYLKLGKAVFRRFEASDGAYVRADASGYQILANFQQPFKFKTVSLQEVLANKVPANLMRDRIVLVGSTASSLKDFFYNAYSGGLINAAVPIPGVEMQAHFISQIIKAAEGKETLINVWSEPIELLWIFGWSWLGASFCWQLRSPQKSIIIICLFGIFLSATSYLALLIGWWIPVVPPMLTLVGSAFVITAYLAHLEEELKRSKEFLQQVINTIADPIFVKDKQHRCIIVNQAYSRFIGDSPENLIGKSEREIFSQDEADVFWRNNQLVFNTGEAQEREEQFTDYRGNIHLIATKRSLHKDAAGNIFLVGVIRDITERKRMEEALKQTAEDLLRSNTELRLSEDRFRYLANHDSLTGLPNRKSFYDRLRQAIEVAKNKNQLVALLFLDLDGFKQVNDTLGHDIGDLLLKVVAQRLTGCLRGSDTVSRLAGDEFTVILPGIPKTENATKVAEKILNTLSEVFVLDGHKVNVTASIGISIYPFDGAEMEILIKNADAAMYRAKESGRNKFYTHQKNQ